MSDSSRERFNRLFNPTLRMAMDRKRDGANSHDIGVAVSIYCNLCEKGEAEKVAMYERAFNAFLSGRMALRDAIVEYRYAGKRTAEEVL